MKHRHLLPMLFIVPMAACSTFEKSSRAEAYEACKSREDTASRDRCIDREMALLDQERMQADLRQMEQERERERQEAVEDAIAPGKIKR